MKFDLSRLKEVDYVDLLLKVGDKAFLAVAALVFVWALYGLFTAVRDLPDVSPSQLEQAASSLRDRLNQSQPTPEALAQLGIVNPDFENLVKQIEADEPPTLIASAGLFYRFVDFGGVLREQPTIFAPQDLYVAADRGGLLLYKLDEKGEKIPVTQADAKKATKPRRPRRQPRRSRRYSNAMAAMMSGMGEMGYAMGGDMYGEMGMGTGMYPGMGMGGYPGMGYGGMEEMMEGEGDYASGYPGAAPGAPPGAGAPAAAPREETGLTEEERASRRIAGLTTEQKEQKEEETPTTAQPVAQQYQQEVRGYRWVVITAVYPHKKQVEEYRKALKTFEEPKYKEVKVERRVLQADGTFSDWQPVDTSVQADLAKRVVNWEPENPELVDAIVDALVQPLPELAYGMWSYVDHIKAIQSVAEAKKKSVEEVAQAGAAQGQQAAAGPYGGYGGYEGANFAGEDTAMEGEYGDETGYPGMGGGYPGMGGGYPGMTGGYPGMEAGGYPGMGSGGYPGMGTGGYPGMGGPAGRAMMPPGTGMPYGQGSQAPVPQQSAAHEGPKLNVEYVQIRFVDYTVEPGRTYQYRMKVVVENPNYKRPDVADESYAQSETLEGPWSDPSPAVYVGKDVEYYLVDVRESEDPVQRRAIFEVHRWDQQTGDWYLDRFETVPGATIGGPRKIEVLTWEGDVVEKQVDFSAGAVLLDVVGGRGQLRVNGKIHSYESPVQALVVTVTGDIIWRVLTDDLENPIRREREEYWQEVREIIKEIKQQENRSGPELGLPQFGAPGGNFAPGGGAPRIPGK